LFNKYFSSVFTVDNTSKPVIQPRTVDNIRCDFVIFNVDNVRKALSSLKPSTSSSSSSGPDGVPNVLLKKLAYSVCNPLCYIFDFSFKSHCLPSQWLQALCYTCLSKRSHVRPVPSNYRPISLTCTCCRIMERIINTQIGYLLSNNLITKHQHGFLQKNSIYWKL